MISIINKVIANDIDLFKRYFWQSQLNKSESNCQIFWVCLSYGLNMIIWFLQTNICLHVANLFYCFRFVLVYKQYISDLQKYSNTFLKLLHQNGTEIQLRKLAIIHLKIIRIWKWQCICSSYHMDQRDNWYTMIRYTDCDICKYPVQSHN